MKYVIVLMLLVQLMNSRVICNFNKESDTTNWIVVNDFVMGGRSSGSFQLNAEGFAVFSGDISLENNGGFSSVRSIFPAIEVGNYKKLAIKLKGDGKKYQLRIKNNRENYYSYVTSFKTSGKWQEIELLLENMYPSFRGRKLSKANFAHNSIEEIAFLIGNKKAEDFKLMIKKIELKQ